MKPYIDLEASFKNLFLTSKKMKSRLRRYWGTHWEYDPSLGESVEVLNRKFTLYPTIKKGNTAQKKAVRMVSNLFGIWRDIKDERFKDIDEYWLFFNPKKVKNFNDLNKDIFINTVNLNLELNEPFTVVVGMADNRNPNVFTSMENTELREYIDSLLDGGYYNNLTLSVLGDTVVRETIASYAFIPGADEFFTTEVVDVKITPIYHPPTYHAYLRHRLIKAAYYTTALEVKVNITQIKNIDVDSSYAQTIFQDKDPLRIKKAQAVSYTTTDVPKTRSFVWDDYIRATAPVDNSYNGIWLNGCIRVSCMDSHVFDRDDFATLIAQSIDSDYEVEEDDGGFFGGFFGAVLAIVIVIVAVVTGVGAAGGWAALTSATGPAALVAWGTMLGVTSLVMTIGQIAMARLGVDVGIMNMYGKIVQVVGIASIATGIASFVSNLAKNGVTMTMESIKNTARDYFFKAAESVSTTTATLGEAFTTAMDSVGTSLTKALGSIAPENMVLRFDRVLSVASKVATSIIDMRHKNEVSDLKDSIDSLQDKNNAVMEELNEISDKELHLGVEDIKMSTQPLVIQADRYNYDKYYEGTRFNIGRPSFVSYGLNLRDRQYEIEKAVSLGKFG